MIQIYAAGRGAALMETERLTAGSAGIQVLFQLDPIWEGLTKVAVFRRGTLKWELILTGPRCTVPTEALEKPGGKLLIGLYGTDGETVTVPTVWVEAGTVLKGAVPEGAEDGSVTPALADQVIAAAEAASTAASAANLALTALRWVTPEMYGAAGDGTGDDTEAFQAALNSGRPVLANGTYAISMVTVKDTRLTIHGTVIGTVRLSNNGTVEGGTIRQTTTDPCVLIESTASGGAGYLNGTLRGCSLKPKSDGVGIRIQAVDNALFGYAVQDVDITSAAVAIHLYNAKWMTKGDIRNVYCHSPGTVIKVENTKTSRASLSDITISNVYAQYYNGVPSYFIKVEDGPVELTVYDSYVYDGIGTCCYWLPTSDGSSKLTLLGRYCSGMTSENFTNRASMKNFWVDAVNGSLDPHWLKCSARRELPVEDYGVIAPEGWTGGPATRFIGLVSRGGYNFGLTIPNQVSGISWYSGRLVLLRSTDGTVASGSYIEVATPRAGAVYTTETLPADALDGATCWCSDIKMQVTRYNNKWYKPDGSELTG